MAANKMTASELDGVQYRRAKGWTIALTQMSNAMSMTFYSLVTYMSYVANEGFGIAMGVAGVLLTGSRVFDGVIDPLIALIMDRVNTRYGKIRIFTAAGWVIRSIAAFLLFSVLSGKNFGIVPFLVLYLIYIFGSSVCDIAGNMASAVITNDPRQRPLVGVWGTVFSYIVPMVLTIVASVVILPFFGNQYNVAFLSTLCTIYIAVSFVFLGLTLIGLTASGCDKTENFEGLSAGGEKVSLRDMWELVKGNRPFQMYILHCVSAKLSQQTMSQAIVSTIVFGILIGNIQFGTILSGVAMLPGIIFAIVSGKVCGKYGSKKVAVFSMVTGIALSIVTIAYCGVIDMKTISQSMVPMAIFFVCVLAINAIKMCITTADNAMRADVVDYELSRSGKYLPAVVTATYNFIDQFISSLGTTIAALGVSFVGYVNTAPQPTDAATPAIKAMGLFLYFGIPVIGWIIGLVSMKFYRLTRERMIEVQKDIAEKKAKLAQK